MVTQVIPCYDVSLSTQQDKIVCQQHSKEVCLDCQVDWTEQNQLAASIKPFKDLPPPNKPIQSVNAQVNRLKLEGNRAYKAQKYEEAIEFYSLAIQLAWSRPLWEPLAFQFVREELAPILSNRSAAHVLLGHHVYALVDAEIVTRLKKDWSKGWFRKGKALYSLDRFHEAIEAYRSGLMFEQDSQDLQVALKEAKNAINK